MSLLRWFRDSQQTRASRARNQDRVSKEIWKGISSFPHYYVFCYPPGRGPGSGWKYPKEYFGPFQTKSEADEAISAELRLSPYNSFKVRRLTSDQFEKIWGSPPKSPGKRG